MSYKHLILVGLVCLGLSTPAAIAADWGFAYQFGDGQRQLALSYAEVDSRTSMREWYLGCRRSELPPELSEDYELADEAGSDVKLRSEACGIGFSWRYFFPTGYFLGVRNDWWRSYYELQPDTPVAIRSRTDSLAPALITGWRLGGEQFSVDLFVSVGREFHLITEGDKIDSYAAVLGGLVFRF